MVAAVLLGGGCAPIRPAGVVATLSPSAAATTPPAMPTPTPPPPVPTPSPPPPRPVPSPTHVTHSSAPLAAPGAVAPVAPPAGGVTAIGDSVMLDAAPNLQRLLPGITIDAVVSRGTDVGVAEAQRLAQSGRLAGNLVVHLGTNGAFTAGELDQLVAVATGRHLILLTDHCPYCRWVAANNATIEAGCTPARRCTVADWNVLAAANPQWFGHDGVHMPIGGPGGQAYAQLVAQRI